MFRSNLHQNIPCKGGGCKISASMKNCICGIMHALRCDWECSGYVFYFYKWPVELRIPFRSIFRNMNEAFISSLIGMHFHKRFCYGELPEGAVNFFLELCECLLDVQVCLSILFAAELFPDQKTSEEEGKVVVTATLRKHLY